MKSAGLWLAAAIFFSMAAGAAKAQDWTFWLGPEGGVRIRARLTNPVENARNHTASVEVEVQNVFLHPPNSVAQAGYQDALIEYQMDQFPAVVTTDTRIAFEQIPSGEHTITVELIGRDNHQLSPKAKLPLKIP